MKDDQKALIKYYKSFYDISKRLNKDEFYEFNMAIFKILFFDEHIKNIKFDSFLLETLFQGMKHSLESSLSGFCHKKGLVYDELFNESGIAIENRLFKPLDKPLDKPLSNKEKEERIKNKEERIKNKEEHASEFDKFLFYLGERVLIKSKVVKTKESEEIFNKMENSDKIELLKIYISHQHEKGEYSKKLCDFMKDIDYYKEKQNSNDGILI